MLSALQENKSAEERGQETQCRETPSLISDRMSDIVLCHGIGCLVQVDGYLNFFSLR